VRQRRRLASGLERESASTLRIGRDTWPLHAQFVRMPWLPAGGVLGSLGEHGGPQGPDIETDDMARPTIVACRIMVPRVP